MKRILKAVILAWITKKIYSRFSRNADRELAEGDGKRSASRKSQFG
jgi:hypothetical protein